MNSSSTWAASSAGRAPRSQRGGREFEPPAVHHFSSKIRRFGPRRPRLRQADVLGARPFRPLPSLERHVLSLAQLVEAHAAARGVMEEVFVAVAGRDKTEALVTDKPFDCAVESRHRCLLSELPLDLVRVALFLNDGRKHPLDRS